MSIWRACLTLSVLLGLPAGDSFFPSLSPDVQMPASPEGVSGSQSVPVHRGSPHFGLYPVLLFTYPNTYAACHAFILVPDNGRVAAEQIVIFRVVVLFTRKGICRHFIGGGMGAQSAGESFDTAAFKTALRFAEGRLLWNARFDLLKVLYPYLRFHRGHGNSGAFCMQIKDVGRDTAA